ncbi:hypothetical protein D3C74_208100 [compost metagenome]
MLIDSPGNVKSQDVDKLTLELTIDTSKLEENLGRVKCILDKPSTAKEASFNFSKAVDDIKVMVS